MLLVSVTFSAPPAVNDRCCRREGVTREASCRRPQLALGFPPDRVVLMKHHLSRAFESSSRWFAKAWKPRWGRNPPGFGRPLVVGCVACASTSSVLYSFRTERPLSNQVILHQRLLAARGQVCSTSRRRREGGCESGAPCCWSHPPADEKERER